MKATALAALALSALATPAFAGPYVESKHEFKGTDDDYSKAVHQGRVGYEWKTGRFSPYVEAGLGVSVPDGGDNDTFKALEVGTKVNRKDEGAAYGKWENIFQDSDDTREGKGEGGTFFFF